MKLNLFAALPLERKFHLLRCGKAERQARFRHRDFLAKHSRCVVPCRLFLWKLCWQIAYIWPRRSSKRAWGTCTCKIKVWFCNFVALYVPKISVACRSGIVFVYMINWLCICNYSCAYIVCCILVHCSYTWSLKHVRGFCVSAACLSVDILVYVRANYCMNLYSSSWQPLPNQTNQHVGDCNV